MNEPNDLFVENQQVDETVISDGTQQTRIVRATETVVVNALGQRQQRHTTEFTVTRDGELIEDGKVFTCRSRRCHGVSWSKQVTGMCEHPNCGWRFCKRHLHALDGKRYCRLHWWTCLFKPSK